MTNNDKTKPLPKFFRHYTDVNALQNILKEGLRLSRPKATWDDLNDYFTVSKYEDHINKDVYVLCLCERLGNIHHWFYYGYSHAGFENIYKNIKCSIKLNSEKLNEALKNRGLELKEMIYAISNDDASLNQKGNKHKTIKEVFTKWEDLPYLKRSEYEIEKEWRVIAEVEKSADDSRIDNSPQPIEILDCIESISLLVDESSCMFCLIKNEIKSAYPQLADKIKSNGAHKSARWKNEIEKVIANDLNNIQ